MDLGPERDDEAARAQAILRDRRDERVASSQFRLRRLVRLGAVLVLLIAAGVSFASWSLLRSDCSLLENLDATATRKVSSSWLPPAKTCAYDVSGATYEDVQVWWTLYAPVPALVLLVGAQSAMRYLRQD